MSEHLIDILYERDAEIKQLKDKITGLEEELDEALDAKKESEDELKERGEEVSNLKDEIIALENKLDEAKDAAPELPEEFQNGVFIRTPTLDVQMRVEAFIKTLYPYESDRTDHIILMK